MSEAIIGKWGKSLAVRVPAEVAQQAGIAARERVDVAAEDGTIVIRRAALYERRAVSRQERRRVAPPLCRRLRLGAGCRAGGREE